MCLKLFANGSKLSSQLRRKRSLQEKPLEGHAVQVSEETKVKMASMLFRGRRFKGIVFFQAVC